jgi:hypothetical protein
MTILINLRIEALGDQVCRVSVFGVILKANEILSRVEDGIRIQGSNWLLVAILFPTLDGAAKHFTSSVGDNLRAQILIERLRGIFVGVGLKLCSFVSVPEGLHLWERVVAELRKNLVVRPIVSDLFVNQHQQQLDLLSFFGLFLRG